MTYYKLASLYCKILGGHFLSVVCCTFWILMFLLCFCRPFLPSVLWRCWLGGRKGIWPVKELSGEVLAWLSIWSKVQTCTWPSWCHCHSLSLASVKSSLFLPFWYWLTQVVVDKGPLNGCVFCRPFCEPQRHSFRVNNLSVHVVPTAQAEAVFDKAFFDQLAIDFKYSLCWCLCRKRSVTWRWKTRI